jgi:putative ABC transport system permease protein
LSFGSWQRRFGADPNIIGRSIELNGTPATVIGIMRPDFRYPSGSFQTLDTVKHSAGRSPATLR